MMSASIAHFEDGETGVASRILLRGADGLLHGIALSRALALRETLQSFQIAAQSAATPFDPFGRLRTYSKLKALSGVEGEHLMLSLKEIAPTLCKMVKARACARAKNRGTRRDGVAQRL